MNILGGLGHILSKMIESFVSVIVNRVCGLGHIQNGS